MAHGHKFNVAKLDRLRDPERLSYLNPDKIWQAIGGADLRTVVDIGAGIGFFAIPFARKIPEGTVYACDLSEEMVGHLKLAIAAEEAANVTPVKTEEVRVPLADGIADLVFMINLHHELDRPADSLAECRRLLRGGGKVAIMDWKPQQTPSGPPIHVRIAPDTVEAQLRAAGFEQVTSHDLLPHHYAIAGLTPG